MKVEKNRIFNIVIYGEMCGNMYIICTTCAYTVKESGKRDRPSTFKIYKILTFKYVYIQNCTLCHRIMCTGLNFSTFRPLPKRHLHTHIHLSIFIMERTEYKVEVKQAIVSKARLLTSHFLNKMDRVEQKTISEWIAMHNVLYK